MYVVVLIVALTVVSVNCQADCPRLNVSELGATDMLTQNGLVDLRLRLLVETLHCQ